MLGDISTPEAVERERRSVTMLSAGAPAYSREEALTILEALARALAELTRRPRRCACPQVVRTVSARGRSKTEDDESC